MQLLLRHRKISRADVFHRVELHLLEPHDLRVHPHVAMRRPGAVHISRFELLQLLHLRVVDGIGEIVAVHPPHVCLASLIIELLHLELPRFVQVDRLLVQRR